MGVLVVPKILPAQYQGSKSYVVENPASEPGSLIAPPKWMQTVDFADAFQAGYSATRRYLLSHGAPIEDAEEIAQAAWARGWEYRDQLRDSNMVGFWVNSIARNLFRARFRRPVTMPIEGLNPSYTMDLQSIELRRLIERCPQRDRRLIEQSLQGYSAEEIAQTQGITSTGIRVRLLRIRQTLRDRAMAA